MSAVIPMSVKPLVKRIRIAEPMIGERELEYVTDAVRRGEISSIGPYVDRFERAFADYCETEHGVCTANGTVALHLVLEALGIDEGDEVIVPALTFVATANAVVHARGVPVFADIDPQHWGLDPEQVRRRITKKTKAIIAVHLYGHPADMDPLTAIAEEHGLTLIEDAAEAHGARYKGRRVGGLAKAGVFSFYGNKMMTTGEGGMVTTNDPDLVARMRQLRGHGTDPKRRYWHPVIGFNYRMTALQAAVGLAQVERAGELQSVKQSIFAEYARGLAGLPLSLQPELPWAEAAQWMMCAVVDDRSPLTAEQLRTALESQGIETRPFFPPIPHLPPYGLTERFPVAERLAERGMNLPSGPKLEIDDVRFVCQAIREHLS
jgi:perosamine synthetase